MMRKLFVILGIGLAALAAAAGGLFAAQKAGLISITRPPTAMMANAAEDTSTSCPHTLQRKDCPFCTPELIESKGFCNGHGVPEALCHLCDPSVIPAFKAKGDWCAEHEAPESLCPVCAPGAGLRYKDGGAASHADPPGSVATSSSTCPHTLAREDCPYCTPKLMVDRGFCQGHNTPEAFCALCNPNSIPALKAAGDWCEEHGQSETFCTICGTAAQVDRDGAECSHGIEPDDCPFCTPELIVSKGFCNGHGVPEAFCYLCNPGIIPVFKARGDWCAEHEAPASLCPVCSPAFGGADSEAPREIKILRGMELPYVPQPGQTICDTESLRVHLAPGIGARIGLELAATEVRELSETHTFNAQLDYNKNQLAQLASRAPGVAVEIPKETGSQVRAGETLAVIDSVEVGNAKADLLQANALVEVRRKDYEREQRLLERGVSTEKDRLAAEAALTEANVAMARARQALRNFGFSDNEIDSVPRRGETDSRLHLTAPFDGVLIERSVALGEVVDTKTPLFRIADPSVMWAQMDIYERELPRVREGQLVLFTPDGMEDAHLPGRITWISTAIDSKTRTLRARAELDNTQRVLRANMFGQAEVILREREAALIVPKQAVQWEGCCHIVFVRQSDMLYQPRKVRLGQELDGHYEIVSGLKPNDPIVTAGSFLLKTEIMKSSIGAGCCEVNPGGQES